MGKRKPETASQMLEALNDFFLGPEPDLKTMSPDELATFVSENRLDADTVFKAVTSALEAARGQVDLKIARQNRLRLRQRVQASAPRQGLRDKLLSQIEVLAGPRLSGVYARKFEKAPDEDLASLLEDFEFLDQLDFTEDEE
jgi:hypothetical protein